MGGLIIKLIIQVFRWVALLFLISSLRIISDCECDCLWNVFVVLFLLVMMYVLTLKDIKKKISTISDPFDPR